MVHLSFCGRNFVVLGSNALFWPEQSALLVADLHFEKASSYARGGQMLPPYDSAATLAALEPLVERTGAQSLYCLGDSFHDGGSPDRLPLVARDRLMTLTGRLDWVWITGNHDAGAARFPGGRVEDQWEVDGVILRHEAMRGECRPEISGHFHPCLRLNMRGRVVSRRCFVRGNAKLIMPAFGALTGGLDSRDPAILERMDNDCEALISAGERLLTFPLVPESSRHDVTEWVAAE